MLCSMRVALGMVVSSVCGSVVMGLEPASEPKPKIELRWLERKHIEGLTDFKMAFPASEVEGDIVYPHRKPALVLTPAMVDRVEITHFVLGSRDQYGVTIQLTQEARKALTRTFKGTKTRWITVVVDGKCWGTRRYEPSNEKSGYSKSSGVWAKNYNPYIGFSSSKAYVQRIAAALK